VLGSAFPRFFRRRRPASISTADTDGLLPS
jgi:hypothetical protein